MENLSRVVGTMVPLKPASIIGGVKSNDNNSSTSLEGSAAKPANNTFSVIDVFDEPRVFFTNHKIDIYGVQISPICSEAENVVGLQVAGIGEGARGNFTGIQIAGAAFTEKHFNGLQISAGLNAVGLDADSLERRDPNGNLNGFQIGGVEGNLIGGNLCGIQIGGGLGQGVDGNVIGLQIGGGMMSGIDGDLTGLQIGGGISDVIGGCVKGIQVGGIMCVSKRLLGINIGLLNKVGYIQYEEIDADKVSKHNRILPAPVEELGGKHIGAQFGICNHVNGDMNGYQTGIINEVEFGQLNGGQIGLVNYAKGIKGVQIGLYNKAESVKGMQVGLVNINKAHDVLMPFISIYFR